MITDLGADRGAFLHRAGCREEGGSHRGWVGRSSLLHNGMRAPHSLRVKLKTQRFGPRDQNC